MGQIIDGKTIAREIRKEIRQRIQELGLTPTLAVVSVGRNDASEVYIRQKKKAADKVGILLKRYPYDSATTGKIIKKLTDLNNNPEVDGILVQLPLPRTIDSRIIMESISPEKDVDGFHPMNYGKLLIGEKGLAPCTPLGIMHMLEHEGIELQGKEVVVVNHSNVVGKPLTLMLLNRNATVSVCHVYTRDFRDHTTRADILITAAGVPGLIGPEMVKEGVVVVDVSMNRVEGRLCGDVKFDEVKEKASLITPVPGGVGPMTVAMLMENTLRAALMQQEKEG
ncbi:MAG: bifunctional 5,10-methylenetetrahydrofolate dehydrogenase/5,10-methenyltetrahydrofolate cyclohydrolase [Thermoplasmata archaeon]|nr:bifunctional 5,10-methylenetetrahydrofolate dehydrogenase/5,10-methenyltetrahydrofolate cyclohydrolase [Thermoplasmata archaeon]